MPQASAGFNISSSAQVNTGVITTTGILDGTIANADISATAAIAIGKLSGVAASGANNDITSLAGLTTKITSAQGGLNLDTSASAQGGILYLSATGVWSVLTPGTSGLFLKTQGASANPIWATTPGASSVAGTFDQDITVTTTITIAHGLGRVPTHFELHGEGIGTNFDMTCHGVYDGTTQKCVLSSRVNADANKLTRVSSKILDGYWDSADYLQGVVSWDATNITIILTKTGTTASRTVQFVWLAQ